MRGHEGLPGDVVVAGAGGFIGGHLVARLLALGHVVRAVDAKPPAEWHQRHSGAENLVLDLMDPLASREAVKGSGTVFNLAADMGGMGFIELNKAACMLSVLTSTQMLVASRDAGVKRYFYSSSACVYPGDKQRHPGVVALREDDAYPADPEDGYGWEKLFSERMCRHFHEDFGIETRVARYHNVYGPHGTWTGGREKAPAAICRKVAVAALTGDHRVDVWGDGLQTRSFMYIDDCIDGTLRLTTSDLAEPVNIGSTELVTVNELVDMVADIAGLEVERVHDLNAPQGVRGRNSDNTMLQRELGWQPSMGLRSGLERTYAWILEQVRVGVAQRVS